MNDNEMERRGRQCVRLWWWWWKRRRRWWLKSRSKNLRAMAVNMPIFDSNMLFQCVRLSATITNGLKMCVSLWRMLVEFWVFALPEYTAYPHTHCFVLLLWCCCYFFQIYFYCVFLLKLISPKLSLFFWAVCVCIFFFVRF